MAGGVLMARRNSKAGGDGRPGERGRREGVGKGKKGEKGSVIFGRKKTQHEC